MAKNQKQKSTVKNGDKINPESCRTCEEELQKNSDDSLVTEAQKVQTKEAKPDEADDLSSAELSLTDLCKEVEKWKNEYLRKAADFENYRKRMIKEKKDAIDYANESILQDLVNVLDDFDRGIDAVEKYAQDAVKPYMQGFTMIRSSLYSMLENKYGLKCYNSKDEVFDPNIHDAKASRESEEVEVETVEKELLKGYKLHDRVIRVAQVETVKPKN